MPTPLPDEDIDDLTARVGRLEVVTADTRADVAFIKATLPHLATRAELNDLRAELKAEIKGECGALGARIERVDGNIARMEARMIKWVVAGAIASFGSLIACAGLAFTVAKSLS